MHAFLLVFLIFPNCFPPRLLHASCQKYPWLAWLFSNIASTGLLNQPIEDQRPKPIRMLRVVKPPPQVVAAPHAKGDSPGPTGEPGEFLGRRSQRHATEGFGKTSERINITMRIAEDMPVAAGNPTAMSCRGDA
jgi:hypothetical protein